ncbi:ethanolamine utilization protein, partial [Candidatus Saccharibacteria bacterium]
RSHKLDNIIERFGFEVENRHRAYDDAEILYKFITHLQQEQTPDLDRHINKLIMTTP